MIKYLKHIFLAAIVLIAATGCQEDIEDTFSKSPKAPVLVNNGSILMTQNTMSESVTWTWTKARFLVGEVSYQLYAKYGEAEPIKVGVATKDLSVSMAKTELQSLLKGFSGIPENASFSIAFYVEASDSKNSYRSENQTMTIYSYGSAVSAVVTPVVSEIVLDINAPTDALTLLNWEPARLTYNEAITYNVTLSYGESEAVQVANGLTATSCTKTVDEWNELAVAAGAPESAVSDVKLTVFAVSETYPEGVPSEPATVKITTYTATYPACYYLPGNYQNWAPDKAQSIPASKLTKGLFEAFVNLTTTDGSDVEFKFNPDQAWNNTDFGFEEVVVSTDKGFAVVAGKTIGSGNVKVPSGFYRISMNKKLNTLEMVQVKTIGLIGNATVGGWNTETKMEYDVSTNTYSVVTTMAKDGGYKFRINDNWDYAIGGDGTFAGDNYTFEKETGEYKIILDVNSHPYSIKVLSTAFPERLYLPGNHQGWNPVTAPTLQGNGEGLYEGGVNLVSNEAQCNWKFSPVPKWEGDFGGTITLDAKGVGTGTYGVKDDIVVPNGYYYVKVDMTAGTFSMNLIDKVGLIGGFNSWGGDVDFTYDATANNWKLTGQALKANDGFKVRFNAGWDLNRGGTLTIGSAFPVYNDGSDMKVAEDGTYNIILDMSSNPNTILVTK